MLYGVELRGRDVAWSATVFKVGLQRLIDVAVGLLTALIDKCGCCGGGGSGEFTWKTVA
jgi:hypothetical protein